MDNNRISPMGTDWDEYKKSVYTEKEILESEIRVALICCDGCEVIPEESI